MRLRLLACALLALATAACAGSAEPEGGFGDPAGLVGRDVVDQDGRFVGEVRAVLVQDFNIISHAMVETGRRFRLRPGRIVAVDINELHAAPGRGGDLVAELGRDEILALPAWEPTELGWRRVEDRDAPRR
ncbi:MAG TPA: hypothetical protein VFG43_03605 [Geminicoccaceae bacterium]|nr:hypothetical protein [Geminicoccaceae bacterium]